MLNSCIEKTSDLIIRKHKRSILLSVFIFCIFIPGTLLISTDYGVKVWFRNNDPMVQGYNFFLGTFGNDDSVVIALDTKGRGLFNYETLKDIQEITELMRTVPDVTKVESLSNYQIIEGINDEVTIHDFIETPIGTNLDLVDLKIRALSHPNMPGLVVSQDGKSALFNIRIRPYFDEQPNHAPIIEKIDFILNKYKNKYSFYKLGTARVTESFRKIAENDLFLMIPLLNILIALILYLIFGTISGVLIPFIIIGLTCGSAMGLSGYLGIKLNNLSGMVPMILIAICIADSIHLLVSYRSLRNFRETLIKNFRPTLLTTISTAIGFFSLGFATLKPIADFGLLCGIGTLLAWIFSYLVIIPIISILEYKNIEIFKIRTRKFRINFDSFVRVLDKYKVSIVFFFSISSILAVYYSRDNQVNSNPFDYFSNDTSISKDNKYFLKKFNGVNGLEFIIDSGKNNGIYNPLFLQKVDQFQSLLNNQLYTNVSYSFLDTFKHLNKAFDNGKSDSYGIASRSNALADQYLTYSLSVPRDQSPKDLVSLNQRYLRVRLLWNIQDSKTSINETERLIKISKSLGLNAYATGQEFLFQGMNRYVVKTYFDSIIISLILITILMSIVFKSLVIGLISIIPNVIPIIIGSIFMYTFNKPIDVGTVLVSSVCFGIAIDDTIHFLSSYVRNDQAGMDITSNIKNIFNTTGHALISTTVILVGGFGVFFFSNFIPNMYFGVFSALVLSVALIVDLLFLPSLFFIFKRKHNV